MNTSELEQKAVQFARQLDNARDHVNAITREYEVRIEARQGQVVATAQQLREPVSAVLDRLPNTARPRWIPVAALAAGVLLVPLALLRWRARTTELLEMATHQMRKVTGRTGASTLGNIEGLRRAAERQAAWLPNQAQDVTDKLTAVIRRAMD